MLIRRLPLLVAAVATLTVVAGCTSGSDGNGTPSATATTTVTTTAPPSSPASSPNDSPSAPTTAATGAPTSRGSSGNASGPGLCTPTVLTFVVGRTDGAAGTAYFPVVVTNASQQPCVTTGFPGVAFLDAAGRQVLQATRDTGTPGATITLAPGEKATAVIAAESASSDESTCATYPAMLFTMPDNTDSTKLVHAQFACAVRVKAFVAGATGL